MKTGEVELFKVEIVRDRKSGKRRVRVWELHQEHKDGQTSRLLADTPLKDSITGREPSDG